MDKGRGLGQCGWSDLDQGQCVLYLMQLQFVTRQFCGNLIVSSHFVIVLLNLVPN